MSSSSVQINKKTRNDQIDELLRNQNIILEAIQNLNERVKAIEDRVDDDKINDLKSIIESQVIIDEIIVKSSDDIALMKKVKEGNSSAINLLESKIDILDKELQKKMKEPQKSNPQNEENIEN